MTFEKTKSAIRYAGYGLVAAGVAAVATRSLRARAGELPPALTGEQREFRWRGMTVAYTERGDPTDETLVLLHGINAAGSSGEWRAVFDTLAEEYHVVAPDLPGFGRSDRPPLRYSAALYEEFLGAFLDEYDSPRIVASSLSAAYAVGALDRGADADELIAVCPTATAGPEPPRRAIQELLRAPLLGELAFAALTAKPSIRYFNTDHAYWDPSSVDEEWTDYEWQTTHQAGARFAAASFIAGYCNSDVALGPTLADLDVPTTIVWGREADLPPLADGRQLAEEADATLVVFDDTMLLPHVEFPEQFSGVVSDATAEVDTQLTLERQQ